MEHQSFTDYLARYGNAYRPELGFNESADFEAWQATLKKKLRDLSGRLPDRVAPSVSILETVVEPDHTRHTLSIDVSQMSTLPAYLLVPHGISKGEKRPALLFSHGHCAYGIDSMCGVRGLDEGDNHLRAYALFAVRSGYVVLAPAWWGWAGRDGHLDLVRGRDKCNVIQMAASMYGLNVLDLHTQDAEAAVDALIARAEVDSERIGCVGMSYGGRTAMWFTIFDERIRVCVAAGIMNTFRERSLKLASCGIQFPHGLLRYADVQDLFCLIAPRPLMLQVGAKDPLITPSDREMIALNVRRAFRLCGAEESFTFDLHDEGHLFLWDSAEEFLDRHLPIDRGPDAGN